MNRVYRFLFHHVFEVNKYFLFYMYFMYFICMYIYIYIDDVYLLILFSVNIFTS